MSTDSFWKGHENQTPFFRVFIPLGAFASIYLVIRDAFDNVAVARYNMVTWTLLIKKFLGVIFGSLDDLEKGDCFVRHRTIDTILILSKLQIVIRQGFYQDAMSGFMSNLEVERYLHTLKYSG